MRGAIGEGADQEDGIVGDSIGVFSTREPLFAFEKMRARPKIGDFLRPFCIRRSIRVAGKSEAPEQPSVALVGERLVEIAGDRGPSLATQIQPSSRAGEVE